MSDPVSNAEVEDVLASIRRLVSGDKPHEQARQTHVTAAPMNDGEAEQNTPHSAPESDRTKLVLTPALRVMTPEDDAPEQAAEPVSEEPVTEPDAAQAEPEEVAPDQDALAAENARTAALLVGLASEKMPDPGTPEPPLMAETPEPESVEAPATPEPASTPDAIIMEAKENPMSLSAKIAALEAVIGKRQDTWEPDGVASEDAYSGTEAPTLAWEDHVAEEDAAPAPSEPELLEAEEYDDEDEATSEPEPPTFSPDDKLGDFGAVAASQEPEQDAAFAEAAEEEALDLTEEPDILDEEALRDMVAEIVREELQGALGERITRNVRKLVRREIQRALAAQDLE